MKTQAKLQPAAPPAEKHDQPLLPRVFAGLFGLLLGLSVMKFGNPIILDRLVDWPTNGFQWLIDPWPVVIAHWLLAGVTVLGLFVAVWKTNAPRYVVALPTVWLVWVYIAGTQSVRPKSSEATLVHFALADATLVHFLTCVICFYLGLFALGRVKSIGWFWAGLMLGFFAALLAGLDQHFGGLAKTRHDLYMYDPGLTKVPKELVARIKNNRIFGTLFYPNALAGVILMLLPATLAVIWSCRVQPTPWARRILMVVIGVTGLVLGFWYYPGVLAGLVFVLLLAILVVIWTWRGQLSANARGFLMAVAALAGLACLFWSGSKGGWLLLLVIGFVAILFLPFKRQLKLLLIGGVLVLGLAGFFAKYMGFFKKGAPSVVARGDYWRAAVQTTRDRPIFGTGPGTFGLAYEKIKKPESEMAWLTHNDYLQQASDSGVPGFLAYTAMIACSLFVAFRRVGLRESWLKLAVWLGVLAWALQSFVEFGLYIPALAWPAFALMGWLLAQSSKPIDTPPVNH